MMTQGCRAPVVVFGANGFLGRYLTRHFARRGREVVAVARRREGWSGDGMFLEWDGRRAGPWALALEGAGLVVNLAGRSVNCRYHAANRREILASRVDSTRAIAAAIRACRVPPRVWMNAATATWYRHAEDRPQDEWRGEPGEGFSVEVAQQWEEAFFGEATPAATRKLALRTAMVLAREPGSVLEVLAGLARLGLGGSMGSGRQRVSWIHLEDWLEAIEFLERDPLADGVFNLSAPQSPTNREWMAAIRTRLGMPLGLPSPHWLLELGARLRATETELVVKSRWVAPRRLREAGFRFRWPELDAALADLWAREGLESFFHVPPRRSAGVRGWTPGAAWQPAREGRL